MRLGPKEEGTGDRAGYHGELVKVVSVLSIQPAVIINHRLSSL